METQLILKRDPTWDELGDLVKKGFDNNNARVVIECQDPWFPFYLHLNAYVHHPGGLVRMHEVLDSVLEDLELPKGRWYVEPISDRSRSFLSRLVYEPLK